MLSYYSNKENEFLMNNIYYPNLIHYFKLSIVRVKIKSGKISRYFTNILQTTMITLLEIINCQHLGYTHSFLNENTYDTVLLFLY